MAAARPGRGLHYLLVNVSNTVGQGIDVSNRCLNSAVQLGINVAKICIQVMKAIRQYLRLTYQHLSLG